MMSKVDDCRDVITRIVRNNQIDINYAKQIASAILERQERDKHSPNQTMLAHIPPQDQTLTHPSKAIAH
jgi:hypothetical protein